MKRIEIFSDGSLNFTYSYFSKSKQWVVFEKDNKNFSLNKKSLMKLNKKLNYFSSYRKKYT